MTRAPVRTLMSAMPTSCTSAVVLDTTGLSHIGGRRVSIAFNHTIVLSTDKRQSAEFLTELFDLPSPTPLGHFMVVKVANDVSLDYMDLPVGREFSTQHYAFLVSESEFDTIYAKMRAQGIEHWADPMGTRPGEINHDDGGRGVYFRDPSGHQMEILTRPYGSRS